MPIDLETRTFAGLIFDCDGTLVDTALAHLEALRVALRKHGRIMPSAWYFARVGLTPVALLDAYEKEFGSLPISHRELLETYKESYQAAIDQLREISIVADVVRAWKGRVPLAVASNGERENVCGSLSNAGLLHLFDTVVSVEDVRQGKPAPDVFLEAARRLGVPPEQCLVLEDSDEGLFAARAAGMDSIDIRESWTPDWKRAAISG